MPLMERLSLTDRAVLFAADALDGYGRFTVTTGVEINVRWEDVRQESSDPQNTVESVPATAFVDRVITVGSVLWHGRLVDLPASPTNLYKVVGYNGTPDIKGRITSHTVTLIRYNNTLPEVTS
jgi:hypothetical protein